MLKSIPYIYNAQNEILGTRKMMKVFNKSCEFDYIAPLEIGSLHLVQCKTHGCRVVVEEVFTGEKMSYGELQYWSNKNDRPIFEDGGIIFAYFNDYISFLEKVN